MKVLSLGTYDVILGMDWLEDNSPMTVDWKAKRIAIPMQQGQVCLCGHEATSTDCFVISMQLQALCNQNAMTHIVQLNRVDFSDSEGSLTPSCIQGVIAEFQDVFREPTELPPRRACDHRIPLIPGAQPFSIRPYRHKPEHKHEIERQVEELLRTGIIQRSTSPFSSPVILVKKKDGTWRMCIDTVI